MFLSLGCNLVLWYQLKWELLWDERCSNLMPATSMALKPSEELQTGVEARWTEWKRFNRLRRGEGRSKEFSRDGDTWMTAVVWTVNVGLSLKQCSTSECPLLEQICTARDHTAHNDTAYKCVQHWLNHIWCLVDLIRTTKWKVRDILLCFRIPDCGEKKPTWWSRVWWPTWKIGLTWCHMKTLN